MIDVIKWCMELGVGTISVYAFSIDNFRRSEAEVEFLMALAQEKYRELADVRAPFLRRHQRTARMLCSLWTTSCRLCVCL